MTNEERILEKLDRMEERLDELQERGTAMRELVEDMNPIIKDMFLLSIQGCQDLQGDVNLHDIKELGFRGLKSVRNINYTLDQLENLIDLWRTIHPGIAPTWPHVIAGLGRWEQEGVFQKMAALKNAGGQIMTANSPEDFERMGESLVYLTRLLQQLADPKVQQFLSNAVEMLGALDMENAKPCGVFGVVGALGSKEAKEGLGVVVELLRNLGKLKGQPAVQA